MEPVIQNEVKEITWPEKTFLRIRSTLPFDKLSEFFGKSYGALYSALGRAGIPAGNPPCAIYYTVDETKKQTDLAAAVPFNGRMPDVTGFEKVSLPASKVLTITHYGSYDSMRKTYDQMEQYMKQHGQKAKLVIEEYLSDPEKEKDPARWMTNIYFVL